MFFFPCIRVHVLWFCENNKRLVLSMYFSSVWFFFTMWKSITTKFSKYYILFSCFCEKHYQIVFFPRIIRLHFLCFRDIIVLRCCENLLQLSFFHPLDITVCGFMKKNTNCDFLHVLLDFNSCGLWKQQNVTFSMYYTSIRFLCFCENL
jgi:hypothetical protein